MSTNLVTTVHREHPDVRPWRGARQQPSSMPVHKYAGYRPIGLADRTWPGKRITAAPLWCSVDLRDGNQALLDPMDPVRKQTMFELLLRMGFKEIEIGYPTSCAADLEFVRHLVRADLVPDDVTVQVMVAMRPELIEETVRAIEGLPRAVLQVFNPTSVAQRRTVFRASREQVRDLARSGAELAMRLRDKLSDTHLALQYAPESFTQTEPEFALDVCNEVLDLWQPTPADDVRVNLPSTVENLSPNEFADRIEWMDRNLAYRPAITLSVHPHNDRGTAVAAAEAAVLAGADRIEGTLFGNGERTGNVCLVTLAMNLFSQGVDPMLELGDIDEIRRITEQCNGMAVSPRHPYGGDLVYTSFAGGHQDAIAKGLREWSTMDRTTWDVPYLPVDPADVGRDYQALIRINNQSGKGGLAYLLRSTRGLDLPRRMQIELAAVVQREIDRTGGELTAAMLWSLFDAEYLCAGDNTPAADPDDAFIALAADHGASAKLLDVVTHPIAGGRHACYCEIRSGSLTRWGAGIATTPAVALARSLHSGLHRVLGSARRACPATQTEVRPRMHSGLVTQRA